LAGKLKIFKQMLTRNNIGGKIKFV